MPYLIPAKSMEDYKNSFEKRLSLFMIREITILKSLDQHLFSIEKRLQRLEDLQIQPELIVTEQIPREKLKEKLAEYIKEHKTTDISELHSAMRCDIEILIEIIDELIKEGRIKED